MDVEEIIKCSFWWALGRCCTCHKPFGKCKHVKKENNVVSLEIPANIESPTAELISAADAPIITEMPG